MAAGPPPLTIDGVHGSVVEIRSLSKHFTRVVLDVPDKERLVLPSGPDTAVGVYFGAADSAPGRTYTVREDCRHHPRIAIDVLMHGDGVGTAWACHAAVGDEVVLAHANSWYRPPSISDWHLLVADMAGLPALARILESPVTVPTAVIVSVPDSTVLDYLPNRHGAQVMAVNGALTPTVMAHTRESGTGYCWFAGEAHDARALRKHLRRELGWEPDQVDVTGYWRRASADWDRRFAVNGADLYSVYSDALGDGMTVKEAWEVFDEALERAGL